MPKSRGTTSWWALICLAASVVLFVASIVFWSQSHDGRRSIDLDSLVEEVPSLGPGAEDVTADVCRREIRCSHAIETDAVLLLRFDSQQDAAAAAAALGGDSRVAGWILMHFKPGGLSAAERAGVAATIYCIDVGPDPC